MDWGRGADRSLIHVLWLRDDDQSDNHRIPSTSLTRQALGLPATRQALGEGIILLPLTLRAISPERGKKRT